MKNRWVYIINGNGLVFSSFKDAHNYIGNNLIHFDDIMKKRKYIEKEVINSCYIKFHYYNGWYISKKLIM